MTKVLATQDETTYTGIETQGETASTGVDAQGEAAYDAFAGEYVAIVPFMTLRKCWDDNVQRVLGDISGRSILDLACGAGHYTRRLKERGAAQVVGVDVSQEMLHIAREEEKRQPLGIEYIHRDVRDLGHVGDFDVVTASFLLNYAPDAEALEKMLRAIRRNLKPGGRLVALTLDIRHPDVGMAVDIPEHGISVHGRSVPLVDGDEVLVTVTQGEHTVQLVNYYLSRSTYDEALEATGFEDLDWRDCGVVSPEFSDAAVIASLEHALAALQISLLVCQV